jgi:hypothetical protein
LSYELPGVVKIAVNRETLTGYFVFANETDALVIENFTKLALGK